MDETARIKAEAAAFRGLVAHLRARADAQNIDLMNLAGFCRNCLAKWYLAAARESGEDIDLDTARQAIYGMPYADWKAKHQPPASQAQKDRYEATKPLHAKIPIDGGL